MKFNIELRGTLNRKGDAERLAMSFMKLLIGVKLVYSESNVFQAFRRAEQLGLGGAYTTQPTNTTRLKLGD